MKLAALLGVLCGVCPGAASPPVFPAPRQIEMAGEGLPLTESVPILLPQQPSAEDRFLARLVAAELSDRYGMPLRAKQVDALPENTAFLLIGSAANPLIAQYCRRHGAPPPQAEGYLLDTTAGAAVVAGRDEAGAFYGWQSLRQLIARGAAGPRIEGARIRDWPLMPFRGIKLYLPGRENIGYFRSFVRDVMALYKYNTMILEMNAGMRFDRHPELNAGWIELGKNLNDTRRDRSLGPGNQFQDSANADAADWGVLEKDEVAGLVRFARQHHIEVIPEIPSLTHSYYLLTRHRELAEIPAAEWPDTYCPSAPEVYPLLFDVFDEYIEVTRPRMVHVGHDEWRMPVGVCPRCRGKDYTELYAADLNRIYAHLRAKGVETAIYGDHLIEPLRGVKTQHVANRRGTPYDTPGALSPDQVRRLIPKDILIFNWFWDNKEGEGLHGGLGEPNEAALSDWGFRQVFGNFEPHIRDFDRRRVRRGIVGGAPSSWAATNELNFGKDLMVDFLGCANLLWSMDRPDPQRLALIVQERLPGMRANLSARPLPSLDSPATSVAVEAGRPVYIGRDVSSLIFVHACRKRARNVAAYFGTWNFADTAELVGWYEAVYEDGFVESIPLRYGVNILEEDWPGAPAPKSVAYQARLEPLAGGRARFAFEWINPRLGKPVREVRLRSVSEENAVLFDELRLAPGRGARTP
jgi:hexosaminidase